DRDVVEGERLGHRAGDAQQRQPVAAGPQALERPPPRPLPVRPPLVLAFAALLQVVPEGPLLGHGALPLVSPPGPAGAEVCVHQATLPATRAESKRSSGGSAAPQGNLSENPRARTRG